MNKLTLLALMFILSFSLHAKTKKEYIVTYKSNPWDTNEPYFDDYTKDSDTLGERLDVLAPEEYKKCQENKTKYGKSTCLSYIKSDLIQTWAYRGTHRYVMLTYSKFKTEPKKLINILKGLDKIREKTRNIILGDERKQGELSYQMINNEICLIESNIGRLKLKAYCHGRRN